MRRVVSSVLIVAAALLLLAGTQLTLVRYGNRAMTASGTYINSQVDTIACTLDGIETSARFFIHPSDSVSLTRVVVRRVVDDKWMAIQAGDTVIAASAAVTVDTLISGAVNITPNCEKFAFVVTYAASNNGVTTPSVTYRLVKNFR